MSNFRRDCLTLDEAMRFVRAEWTGDPHIRYDPAVRPQYRIIRGMASDGTMMFDMELVADALQPLLRRESYFKPDGWREGMMPRYVVGLIRLATVYGRVDLPVGRYPGQRMRVRIPVRIEGWDPEPRIFNFRFKPMEWSGSIVPPMSGNLPQATHGAYSP